MARYYSFPPFPASDECPTVPRAVKVWGDHTVEKTKNDGGAALAVLARALEEDPKLEKEHPEFLSPEDQEKKVTKKITPVKK